MEKTKFNIFKRLMALILVLLSLSSALPLVANAGDAVFLETLINTDKYTYVANLTRDTKNKNKKYAYKYLNMAYLLGEGCTGNKDLNSSTLQENPNYCFRLDPAANGESVPGYASTSNFKNEESSSGLKTGKPLDMFLLLEGYVKDDNASVFIKDDDQIGDRKSAKNKLINKGKAKKTTSPLSYPGYYTETVTTEQIEYAQSKLTQLVGSLNGILTEVNDGVKFTSVADMVNKSILIRPDNSKNTVYIEPNTTNGYGGYFIVYADLKSAPADFYETSTGQANRILNKASDVSVSSWKGKKSYEFLRDLGLPRANTDKELYAYVFPVSDDGTKFLISEASMFVYAIPKGFTDISVGSAKINKIFTDQGDAYDYTTQQTDTPWITIHMLSFYANNVYKHENISVSTYTNPESNIFTNIIVGLFNWILDGIRNVLGLASIEELVFNLGARGSAAFNFGLMSENWWNVVLQYQLVFQAIAWVMLVCGFIKMLIDLNLSTINPQKRLSVYETIQKFIVVGIGLVILIPCTQFLLECNNTLVELFASQIETSRLNMPNVSNAIVQILVGIIWITILLYVNFLYIMRSITVALLIASGPFFIATMAFSQNGKSSLFVSWAKELLANIFVQSVHAFVLSFLVQLLAAGTFLETFAIAISIIPITEMFRGLIFAGAGGSTSQMANTAAGAMKKMGTAAVKAGVNVAGGIAGAATGMGGDGGGGGGSGGGGGGGKGGNQLNSVVNAAKQAKMDKIANGSSIGSKLKDKMEQKGMKGAGAAGKALDIAGMAGLSLAGAASHMGELADIVDNMGELALKGDTAAAGKAVETAGNMTKSIAENGIKNGKAAHQAGQNAKNRQKTNAKNTTSTAQMGGAAQNKTSGQNTNGGTMQTGNGVTQSVQVSGVSTTDFSNGQNISTAQQAKALQDFRAAEKAGNGTAVAATVNGRDGTQYNFKDSKGNQQSFFMDKETHSALIGSTSMKAQGEESSATDKKIDEKLQRRATSGGSTDYTAEGVGKAASYKTRELDASGSSIANRKAALATAEASRKAGHGSVQSVKMKDSSGKMVDGQRFTYRDEKTGREKSFVMTNDAIKEAQADTTTAAADKFNRSSEAGNVMAESMETSTFSAANDSQEQRAHAAMASKHGTNLGQYYGKDGEVAGNIYDYQGQQIAVPQETVNKADSIIEEYTNSQMAKGGVEYQQRQDDYAANFSERHGGTAANPNVDLSNASKTGDYVDAAMAVTLGKKVEGSENTYSLGNNVQVKVPASMTKSAAAQILQQNGIVATKNGTAKDASGNTYSTVSYTQKNPSTTNPMYVASRTAANGGLVTQMNTRIGKEGGPQSFTSDGNGGGTMSFASKESAMTYLQQNGASAMADHIGGMTEKSTSTVGAQTFKENDDGTFSIGFNGRALKDQGMAMEMHSDGHSMMVSSNDNQPKDPFKLDTEHQVPISSSDPNTNTNTERTTAEDYVDSTP